MSDKFNLMSDSQKIRHLQLIIRKHEETIAQLNISNRQLREKLKASQNSFSSVDILTQLNIQDSDSQQLVIIVDKIIGILNTPIYTHAQIDLIKKLLL